MLLALSTAQFARLTEKCFAVSGAMRESVTNSNGPLPSPHPLRGSFFDGVGNSIRFDGRNAATAPQRS
jgi:hypothetical protein